MEVPAIIYFELKGLATDFVSSAQRFRGFLPVQNSGEDR